MAEYIRFRWTRAKAGVTMAFLALLGGLAEQSASADAAHQASAPSFEPKLSLGGLSGNLRSSLVKLDKAFNTIYARDQKAISSAINKIYIKMENNFLTQSDAGKLYLKERATAANSELLGNLAPSAFIHGTGGVVSGAVSFAGGSGAGKTLIPATGDGGIIVVCTPLPGSNNVVISVDNTTGLLVPAVQDINGNRTSVSLGPGTTQLTPNGIGDGSLVTLQTFPTNGFNNVLTLTVSATAISGGGLSVAGQLVNGVNGDG